MSKVVKATRDPEQDCFIVNGKRYYARSSLRRMGWTDEMFPEILPDPDLHAQNPHNPGHANMLLWEKDFIDELMGSTKFKEEFAGMSKEGSVRTLRKSKGVMSLWIQSQVPTFRLSRSDKRKLRSSLRNRTPQQAQMTINRILQEKSSYNHILEQYFEESGVQVDIEHIQRKFLESLVDKFFISLGVEKTIKSILGT